MRKFFRFLTFLLLLTSCETSATKSSTKHDYSEISEMKISYLDVFNVEENEYYIYYYQESCYHCHGIKSKVISFALESDVGFYFVEVIEDYGFLSHTKEETIGTNNPMKAFALMTPQLSLVKNGYIAETYIGNEEILNIIE